MTVAETIKDAVGLGDSGGGSHHQAIAFEEEDADS